MTKAFDQAFADFKRVDAGFQPRFRKWRDAARRFLEPVILDVMQAYGLKCWAFEQGDGCNDEGRYWIEYAHGASTQNDNYCLDGSSAYDFSSFLQMLQECEVTRVKPRKVLLGGPDIGLIDQLLSRQDFLFVARHDQPVEWK